MKKKSILLGGALLLTIAGSVVYSANKPMSAEEVLLMRNIEAIAKGEAMKKSCETNIVVKSGHMTFFCGTCDWVENASEAWNSSTSTCSK